MPAGTFDGNNMLMKDEMKPQSIARLCRRHWYAKKLHIVIIFWLFKALTTTYCVICMSSVESCLCLKVLREFPRGRPLQWVEKTIDLPRFLRIFEGWKLTLSQNVRSGINKGVRWQHHRNIQPGHGDAIRHKYGSFQWKGMVLSGINARTPVAIWVISGINTWIPMARWWCHQE